MNARSRSRKATINRARRRLIEISWSVIPSTMAATAAWLIAKQVGGHPDPFFAPLAAVIALNAPLGERGLNAIRLLMGVVLGIVVGSATVRLLDDGYIALAVAVFVAMVIAGLLGGYRIVIAQAAAGAILTVASVGTVGGIDRLIDALIGGGVAIVFSQVIFAPQPVALLRSVQARMLEELALGLQMNAEAIEREDPLLARQSVFALREVRNHMGELARLRRASQRVARHSLLWRSQLDDVIRESEEAFQLEVLGDSCLTLSRVATAPMSFGQSRIASSVAELSSTLAELGHGLGARSARQRAAQRALRVARELSPVTGEPELAAVISATQLVATDVMVFAGVAPGEVKAALNMTDGVIAVSEPPPVRAHPLDARRWRVRR